MQPLLIDFLILSQCHGYMTNHYTRPDHSPNLKNCHDQNHYRAYHDTPSIFRLHRTIFPTSNQQSKRCNKLNNINMIINSELLFTVDLQTKTKRRAILSSGLFRNERPAVKMTVSTVPCRIFNCVKSLRRKRIKLS